MKTHFVSKKVLFASAFFMKFLETVKAICADSFITSPRCPVNCNEPLDLLGLSSGAFNFRLAVSINRVEPPVWYKNV